LRRIKSRAEETAGWFIAWGVAGSIAYVYAPGRGGKDQALLWFADLVAVVLWSCVLKRRWWARNALIGLLALQFLEMIHYAIGMPAAHGAFAAAFWTYYIPVACVVAAWQLLVLLAEKREEWARDS